MSRSTEDYMKAICELGGAKQRVTNKAIREALDVSAASVTGMIHYLEEAGYVDHLPYQGVKLTERGSRFAARVIRRHRLWEVFLYDKLDYPWEEVHAEAEDLEHHASDEFMDRLEKYLDYPSYCPHGGVIPAKNGTVPEAVTKTLWSAAVGTAFQIVRVVDEKAILRAVDAYGLVFRHRYTVTKRSDEALALTDGTARITVPRALSEHIFIAVQTA